MRLNCDLGESFGAWSMGMDEAVMPHIDQANIACGFHAGDPQVMRQTLLLAKQHGVSVGAHPGYPDLAGFGRRSLACRPEELVALLQYQVAALDGMAASQGLTLDYVKPHGALYNDMMARADVRRAVIAALATYHRPLALMLQATPQAAQHRQEVESAGLEPIFEAFADRRYDDDGLLLARQWPGALLDRQQMLQQVQSLVEQGCVTTVSGQPLTLQADSICVHGDNLEAVAAIEALRRLLPVA